MIYPLWKKSSQRGIYVRLRGIQTLLQIKEVS